MRSAVCHARNRTYAPATAYPEFSRSIVSWLAAVLLAGLSGPTLAGEPAEGLLAPGNAVVSHFSGVVLPDAIPIGADPFDQTRIDREGASLRVLDLQLMGASAAGQVVNPPRPYAVTAEQIGQVFGIALDDAWPPNIYAAATSVYGLPVVAQGSDPQNPQRLKRGARGTAFMEGLWGPPDGGGGPGSIWKIDGKTGAVSLFANITLNGVSNSGPALGGIVLDPQSRNLYVADRETGMIHRFDSTGADLDHYDHGIQGRPVQNLAALPLDPSKRLNIQDQQFDPGDSSTWNYAPPERRVYGLGIHAGRLYYAVAAGPHIWSVELNPDGSFGDDPKVEIAIPPASAPTEISKIAFDDQGRMFLAERTAPSGAYDFGTLMQGNVARVMRYAIVDSYKGAPRVWQPEPDEYAIGLQPDHRYVNGGVAIGYEYDDAGVLNRASCGGFLWSTGEPLLRSQSDLQLVEAGAPLSADGLQGNRIGLIRPLEPEPLHAYFIDYDGIEPTTNEVGQVGDVAIWRVCGPPMKAYWPDWLEWSFSDIDEYGGPEIPPPPVPLSCPVDLRKPGYQCCPQGTSPNADGACKAWCLDGAMDAQSQQFCGLGFDPKTHDPNNPGKLRCLHGSQPDLAKGFFACADTSPVLNAPLCQAGWEKQEVAGIGKFCLPTNEQKNCPSGAQVSSIDGQCHRICLGIAWPREQCCPSAAVLSSTGRCCPPGSLTDPRSGLCALPIAPAMTPPPGAPSSTPAPGAGAAPHAPPSGEPAPSVPSTTPPPGTPPATPAPGTPSTVPSAGAPSTTLAPGTPPTAPSGGAPSPPCPAGQLAKDNTCCPKGQVPNNVAGGCCPANMTPSSSGKCEPRKCEPPHRLVSDICCSPSDLLPGGNCATLAPSSSSSSVPAYPQGRCQPGQQDCCETGYTNVGNMCCRATQVTSTGVCCPSGQMPSASDKSQCVPVTAGTLPPQPMPTGGAGGIQCCMPGSIPAADGMCCRIDLLTRSGTCCPEGRAPEAGGTSCGPGPAPQQLCQGTMINGECCPRGQATPPGPNQKCCPPRTHPDPLSRLGCTLLPTERTQIAECCSAGLIPAQSGTCCATDLLTRAGTCCPIGQRPDADGLNCVASCPPGYRLSGQLCVRDARPPQRGKPTCRPGWTKFTSVTRVPNGWTTDRVTSAGTTIICAKPSEVSKPDSPPAPPPSPASSCGNNAHRSDGECVCDRGFTRMRGTCVAVKQERKREPVCGANEHASDGECVCDPGFNRGRRGRCVLVSCPDGMTGTPPNCRPIVRQCPEGQIGRWPNCRVRSIPERRPKPQQPASCPEGMTGTPPNCHPAVRKRCPPGTIGIPPRCSPRAQPRCPEGMTGTPPNCYPIVR